ncbi:MAG: baseplate J/gp47 family protein, partial [Verrucomicrobiae bacterium]|nr:baseplate J/gp47 family protein [Verrucomicrobiae bacterium]
MTFRQGTGSGGNLPAGSLTQLVRPHALIEKVMQPIQSSGGADRESNEDLRKNAPATLLALDRAVSLEDYTQLARGHASVSQACAFRHPAGLGQREWLEVVVMAAGGGTLSAALKGEVQTYLQARAQPGVVITVTDYVRLTFHVAATVRVDTAVRDPQTVMDSVRTALLEAFSELSRELGQALYRGEVYQVLDGIPGVENSDCSIVLDPVPEGVRVTRIGAEILTARPGPGQCLVLDGDDASAIAIAVE